MMKKHIEQLKKKHICVIGDLMLDVFAKGRIDRRSPEAPVDILDIHNTEERPGGALNVCMNLQSLGVNTEIIGVVGDDFTAFSLEYLCDQHNIKREGLFRDRERITSKKTRFFNGGKQVLRVDQELRSDISKDMQNALLKEIHRAIKISDIIILQDYNKGVLTKSLITEIMHLAKKADVPVFVDPKVENIEAYKAATLIKPNRYEAEAQLNYEIKEIDMAKKAAKDLLEKLACDNVLLTLGNEGMILCNKDKLIHVHAKELSVSDITGAGDTVISVVAALYSTGLPLETCVHYANQAAGETCKEQGVVPATLKMLY
ncbi:MAG: PfkB family carbohydrate kinase [Candidatus Neomarinimicrobiota bacterium]